MAMPRPLKLVADVDPFSQFSSSVDDDVVPRFGYFLDAFAVAQPADVGKVSRDGVNPLDKFGGSGHPRNIN